VLLKADTRADMGLPVPTRFEESRGPVKWFAGPTCECVKHTAWAGGYRVETRPYLYFLATFYSNRGGAQKEVLQVAASDHWTKWAASIQCCVCRVRPGPGKHCRPVPGNEERSSHVTRVPNQKRLGSTTNLSASSNSAGLEL
jgi:hypothetical protein